MSPDVLADVLQRQCGLTVEPKVAAQLSRYLELLLRWNGRTNLTAIREPEQIIIRHFGESLQCARALPAGVQTLLDFGSGAGFPGAVCALQRPQLSVTLAESQGKKAAFLQELCRTLGLTAAVFAGRVEELPAERLFDAVTMRAVDNMETASAAALRRVAEGGWLVMMTTEGAAQGFLSRLNRLRWVEPVRIEGSRERVIVLGQASQA